MLLQARNLTHKAWEHTFSIEMGSKRSLKNIKLTEAAQDSVLIEGSLGELEEVKLHEDVMLEVRGANGTLRLDVNREELERCLRERTGREGV